MSLVQAIVSAAFAPAAKLVFGLLHVRHLPSQKGHFQIFVRIRLLGPEIDDLLRGSHRRFYVYKDLKVTFLGGKVADVQ